MALEPTFDFPDDLNTANPANGDDIDEGAAHLRGIKNVVQNVFRDFSGSPLDKSIFDAVFPAGVSVITTGEANPGNQIGGTWSKFGELKTVSAVDEEGAVAGDFPDSPLYVWRRIV
jgi:hypothetical protein